MTKHTKHARRSFFFGISLAAIALVLSGCNLLAPAESAAQPTGSPAASPSPSSSDAPSPSSSVSPVPTTMPANVPVDGGPREHAAGDVTVDSSGVPVEYVVASNDNAGAICNRLGVRWWQLENRSGERLGTYPMLYPGDVIVVTVKDGAAHDLNAPNALC